MTPGGYFGERALLRDVPRMATVRSREPMDLLALQQVDFVTALTGQEGAAAAPADARSYGDAPELTRRQRVDVLSRVSLLSHLDSSALRQVAEHSTLERWPEGAAIIRKGQEGDRFFVMLEGRAVVSDGSTTMGELLPGDQFGEIALLHQVPRRADVTATSPATTLSLPRDAFVSAVRSRVLAGRTSRPPVSSSRTETRSRRVRARVRHTIDRTLGRSRKSLGHGRCQETERIRPASSASGRLLKNPTPNQDHAYLLRSIAKTATRRQAACFTSPGTSTRPAPIPTYAFVEAG